MRAAALAGGGPQACPAGCARIQALLCHSERSEESFPLRGIVRKRPLRSRRSSIRCAQHDGCSGSSQRSERQTKCSQTSVSSAYRFFVALLLRMTNCFLIVNSELCILNCSRLRGRLEYATGGNTERWREKMFGAVATCRAKHRIQLCEPKPRPAEARRIYKSPFLTGLAPLASAREHLLR